MIRQPFSGLKAIDVSEELGVAAIYVVYIMFVPRETEAWM